MAGKQWVPLFGGSTVVWLFLYSGYNDIPGAYSQVGWYEAFIECH